MTTSFFSYFLGKFNCGPGDVAPEGTLPETRASLPLENLRTNLRETALSGREVFSSKIEELNVSFNANDESFCECKPECF